MELIQRTGGVGSVVVFIHFPSTGVLRSFFFIDPLILHSLPCSYSDFWVPVSKDAPVRSWHGGFYCGIRDSFEETLSLPLIRAALSVSGLV